jgi:hypothetical protein
MSSFAAFFPPGTDLCTIPDRLPPDGTPPDFNNPGLRLPTIILNVTLTTIAGKIALGRLYNNFRKPGLSDRELYFKPAHAVRGDTNRQWLSFCGPDHTIEYRCGSLHDPK